MLQIIYLMLSFMDTEYFVVFKEMNVKDDFKIKIVLNIEVLKN